MEDDKKTIEYEIHEYNMEPIYPYGDYKAPEETPVGKKDPRTTVCPQAAVEEMRQWVDKADSGSIQFFTEKFNPDASKEHLHAMLDKIESGEVSGDKAHRWLGYIQGVLVATRNGTVKDFGGVNKRSKR